MAAVSTADIKKLRESTGAGMVDCKNALVQADGNYDKAVEQLRIKGLKRVAGREGRSAGNGLIASKVEGGRGTLLELNCETDFVAKSDPFQQLAAKVIEVAFGANDTLALMDADAGGRPLREVLEDANVSLSEKIEVRRVTSFDGAYVGSYLHRTSPDLPPQVGVLVELSGAAPDVAKDIAQHIAAVPTTRFVTREEVPDDVVAKEREIAEATAREEGKPEAALSRIVDGRVNGFFKESVLVDQDFVKDPKKKVGAVAAEAGVSITGFARFRVGQA